MRGARIGNNEGGFVLVGAIVILLLLVIIGIAATATSTLDLQIASADKVHTMSFYAAESGRAYLQARTDLYGSANVVEGEGLSFPNKDDAAETQTLGTNQTFKGTVTYEGATAPPRGSPFAAGSYQAHHYRIESYGYGPNGAESKVEAEFYRIGF